MTQSIFEQHDILDRLFDELKRSYQEGSVAGYEQLLTVAPALTAEEYELVIERFIGYMRNQELLAIKEQEKELRAQLPFVPEGVSAGLLSLEQQFFRSFSRFLVERDRKIARAAAAAMDEVRSGRSTLEEEIKTRSAAYEERITALEAALAQKDEQLRLALADVEQARSAQCAAASELERLTLEDEGLELLRALTMDKGLNALQGLPYNRTLNSCLSSVFELMQGLDENQRRTVYRLLYKVENLAAVARSLGYNLKEQCRSLTDADGARHALATADAACEAAALTAGAAGRDAGLSGPALDDAVNKAAVAAREAAFAAAVAARGISSSLTLPPMGAAIRASEVNTAALADSVATQSTPVAPAASPAAADVSSDDANASEIGAQVVSSRAEQEAALAALKERYKNVEQLGADESYIDEYDGPHLTPEEDSALRTAAAASAALGGVNTPSSMAEMLAAAGHLVSPASTIAAIKRHNPSPDDALAASVAAATPVLGDVPLTAIQQRTVDGLVPIAAGIIEGRSLSSVTSFDIEKGIEKARDVGIIDEHQSSAARRLIIKLLFTSPDKIRLTDFSGNNDDFINSLPDDSARVFARTVLSWAEPGSVKAQASGSTSALPPGSPLNSVLAALSSGSSGSAGTAAGGAAGVSAVGAAGAASSCKDSPVELLNSSSPKALPRDEGTLVREISSEKGNVDIAAFAEASARIASLAPLLNEAGRELRQVKKDLEADIDKSLGDASVRSGADSAAAAADSGAASPEESGSSATVEIASVAKDVLKVASELQRSGDRSRSDRKFSIFDSSAPADQTGTTVFGVGKETVEDIRAEALAEAQERSADESLDDDLEDFIGGNIREADSSDVGIPDITSDVTSSASHGSKTGAAGAAAVTASGAGAGAAAGAAVGSSAGPLSVQSRTQTTPLGTTNIIRTSTLADEIASRKAAISASEHSRDSLTAADLENTFRSKDIKTAIAASASAPAGGDRRPGEELSQYDVAFAAAAAARNARQDNEGSTIVVSTHQGGDSSQGVSGAAILGAGAAVSTPAANALDLSGAATAAAAAAATPADFKIRNGLNEDNRRRFELLCQIIDKKLSERIKQLKSLLSSPAGGPDSQVKLQDIEFFYRSCISSLDGQGLLSDDLKAALFEKMEYDIKTCSEAMASGTRAPRQPYIPGSEQRAATDVNQDGSDSTGSRGSELTAGSLASRNGEAAEYSDYPSSGSLTDSGIGHSAPDLGDDSSQNRSQSASDSGSGQEEEHAPDAAGGDASVQPEIMTVDTELSEDRNLNLSAAPVFNLVASNEALPGDGDSLSVADDPQDGSKDRIEWSEDHDDSNDGNSNDLQLVPQDEDEAEAPDVEPVFTFEERSGSDAAPAAEDGSEQDSTQLDNSEQDNSAERNLQGVTFSSLDGFEQGEKYASPASVPAAPAAQPEAEAAAASADAAAANAVSAAARAAEAEQVRRICAAIPVMPKESRASLMAAAARAAARAAEAEQVRRICAAIPVMPQESRASLMAAAAAGAAARAAEAEQVRRICAAIPVMPQESRAALIAAAASAAAAAAAASDAAVGAEPGALRQPSEAVEINPAPEGCHDGTYALESVHMSSGSVMEPQGVTGSVSAAVHSDSELSHLSPGVITSDDGVLPITPASAYISPDSSAEQADDQDDGSKSKGSPEDYSNTDTTAFGFGEGLCSVYGYPSQASFVFHEGLSDPDGV